MARTELWMRMWIFTRKIYNFWISIPWKIQNEMQKKNINSFVQMRKALHQLLQLNRFIKIAMELHYYYVYAYNYVYHLSILCITDYRIS